MIETRNDDNMRFIICKTRNISLVIKLLYFYSKGVTIKHLFISQLFILPEKMGEGVN